MRRDADHGSLLVSVELWRRAPTDMARQPRRRALLLGPVYCMAEEAIG